MTIGPGKTSSLQAQLFLQTLKIIQKKLNFALVFQQKKF